MRVVCLCLSLCALRAHAEPLRLADVLAEIDARGPDALVLDAQLPIARADVRTARMFPNPGISVGGGRAEPAFNASLILRLPIFGQRGAQVRASEAGVRQSEAETSAARWQLRRAARLAYYGVARADEEVGIAIEIEALAARIADMAREKYEVGSGTRLDERQAALVHSRALQDVRDRRAAARVARIELARQLDRQLDTLGPVADVLATVGAIAPADELVAASARRHPELRALHEARDVALLRARAAHAELRPNLTLELGVELLDPVTCSSAHYCVGPRGIVGFDLPLFNLNGGPIERAQAEAHLADVKAAALARRIDAEVRGAYTTLDAAEARVHFFDTEYVANALDVAQMAKEGFAVGRSGILPLIEAERAVLDARLGRVDALYAVQAARADLEEASGLPLSTP